MLFTWYSFLGCFFRMVLCKMCTFRLSVSIQRTAVLWCLFMAPNLWSCHSERTRWLMSRKAEWEKGTTELQYKVPQSFSSSVPLLLRFCFYSRRISFADLNPASYPVTSLMFVSWMKSCWTSSTWSSSMVTTSPRCSFCLSPTKRGLGESLSSGVMTCLCSEQTLSR